MCLIIALPVTVLMVLVFLGTFVFKKRIGHDLFGWHEPISEIDCDGCSLTSKCKYCGKNILMDGQGNWF